MDGQEKQVRNCSVMMSPKQQLIRGALLGDVVEKMTGRDPRIRRFDTTKVKNKSGTYTCNHKTRIYSGHYLIAVADVLWVGKLKAYSKLVRERMRQFLKRRNVRPTIQSKNVSKSILIRHFAYRCEDGYLDISEHIFLKKLNLLKS